MSNARKDSRTATAYRTGYLRSGAWFARRDAFFATRAHCRCVVCARATQAPVRELELHHISYDRVIHRPDGTWLAGETDADLLPMHPVCHEAVHRVLERDRMLRGLVSRIEGTRRAIAVVRAELEHTLSKPTHQPATAGAPQP